MNFFTKFLLGILSVGLLIGVPKAQAEVLDGVDLVRRKGQVIIRINFTTPVHYKSHFPKRRGRSLEISLSFPGARELERRRSYRVSKKKSSRIPVRDVVFEGDTGDGPRLTIHFSRITSYKVKKGRDGRSIEVVILQQKKKKRSASKRTRKPRQTLPANARQTGILVTQSKKALKKNKNVRAIQLLSRALKFRENKYSREALELLGVARERNGQKRLAAVEYKLYLKKYPKGKDARRVRQRLLALEPGGRLPRLRRARRSDKTGRTVTYGTFSQMYYHGNSKIDTTLISGPVPEQLPTLNQQDQSSLITNLTATTRYRSASFDNRLVFSGDHSYNFLNDEGEHRIRKAYGQVKNRIHEYSIRVGRQSGHGGGVLGRFDGALAGYTFLPKWRINVVQGTPNDTVAEGSDREFTGASINMGTFNGSWSTSLYSIKQTVDGVTDREAYGLEYRYFKKKTSVFSMLDYDVYFDELNIFLIQTNWQKKKNSYNLLLDYRRNPSLQLTNALLGESEDSIDGLSATYSLDEMKQMALDKTSTSKMLSAGITHQWTKRFQLGSQLDVINVSGLPASGALPVATPGTGNIYTVTGKLIGTKLITKYDVTVIGGSYTVSSRFTARSIFLTNRTPLKKRKWRINTSLKWYRQENTSGNDLDRFTPSLRVEYRKNGMTFEVEYGQEQTVTNNPSQKETIVRDFITLGYRWDF